MNQKKSQNLRIKMGMGTYILKKGIILQKFKMVVLNQNLEFLPDEKLLMQPFRSA